MTEHKCPRCDYTTKYIFNLRKHLQRKSICQPTLSDTPINQILTSIERNEANGYIHKCDNCDKRFKSLQSKQKHQIRCTVVTNNDTNANVVVFQEQFRILQEHVKTLEQKIDSLPKSSHTVTNTDNSIHNNAVNQVVINLKSFGQENLKHIETDKQFLTNCLISKDIKSLIESIHCDKAHPENHNVRIKSTKQELMETFVDGGWIVSDQEETLDELLNKGYRVLRLHSHRNKNEIKAECDDDDDEYDSLVSWLEDVYDDKKVRKPIKRQLLILFMNRRTMLLEKQID